MPEEVNEQLVQIVERWRGSPYDFVIECLVQSRLRSRKMRSWP